MTKDDAERVAGTVARLTRDIADFPQPGVLFKDLSPLLADPVAIDEVVTAMAERVRDEAVQRVVGIDARGFALGALVARQLDVGLTMARKAGKLPGETVAVSYDLEYGTAELELQADALEPASRVLVVDDVLATGGTLAATTELVGKVGARCVGAVVLLEIGFLGGRQRLDGIPLHAALLV